MTTTTNEKNSNIQENNDFQDFNEDNIKFPPELETSISNILQINDPLDGADFNPIEYLNQMLPDEHALTSIDVTGKKLQTKMRQLEADIRELTKMQINCGQRGAEEVAEAKRAIEELFNQIRQIKEKASQSEIMVQEITQDIKSLDYAKKHLTISITALKRLQMLVTAVSQLKIMAQRKQYKETAQLLQAVLQLGLYFKSYKNIKQIATLSASVNSLQNDLKKQIFDDFESSFSTDGSLIVQTASLDEACLVIEIIGADVRKQLISWYYEKQLGDYKRIFRSEENSSLENTSRRYSWLKRVLKNYDEKHSSIFPVEWRGESELDVKILLKNLQLTIEFENQLTKRFSNVDDPRSSKVEINFSKKISISFEPYLGLYIDAEDKKLSEIINSYRLESVPDDDSSTTVLQSSTDLFYFYRETLANCAKLSTKKPLFDLYIMFAKWLRIYASEVLIGRLPKEERKSMSRDDSKLICFILNTADYCHDTTSQLEDKLKEKIHDEYKEKINFDNERNHFRNVVTSSIKSLIRGIESCYEPSLVAMTKIQWSNLDSVGDQSEYVTLFHVTLRSNVVNIHKDITNNRYFRTFCDRFVESFVSKLINNLSKCKPISEVGAEQMLLDTYALKTSLLEMPTMGMENPDPPPTTKIETILKTILKSHDPPEGLVENYIFLIADKNLGNFQKILELKGLKKNEQPPIIEIFQQRILDYPKLSENSNIMSSITLTPFITTPSLPSSNNNNFSIVLAGRSWRKKDGKDGLEEFLII
ncbi:11332_t:CDS:10 [Diversispora eburnea]|uniref:11332_t:CDS:1 n=1 Tax=Diversispora eburnea TaxID=1213867 RepID=A0A9N9BSK8_9GLOM|nr:11332_t:CDS:10 [Diversispora eburnea]